MLPDDEGGQQGDGEGHHRADGGPGRGVALPVVQNRTHRQGRHDDERIALHPPHADQAVARTVAVCGRSRACRRRGHWSAVADRGLVLGRQGALHRRPVRQPGQADAVLWPFQQNGPVLQRQDHAALAVDALRFQRRRQPSRIDQRHKHPAEAAVRVGPAPAQWNGAGAGLHPADDGGAHQQAGAGAVARIGEIGAVGQREGRQRRVGRMMQGKAVGADHHEVRQFAEGIAAPAQMVVNGGTAAPAAVGMGVEREGQIAQQPVDREGGAQGLRLQHAGEVAGRAFPCIQGFPPALEDAVADQRVHHQDEGHAGGGHQEAHRSQTAAQRPRQTGAGTIDRESGPGGRHRCGGFLSGRRLVRAGSLNGRTS